MDDGPAGELDGLPDTTRELEAENWQQTFGLLGRLGLTLDWIDCSPQYRAWVASLASRGCWAVEWIEPDHEAGPWRLTVTDRLTSPERRRADAGFPLREAFGLPPADD